MRPLCVLLLLTALASMSSCYITKTYQLDVNYTQTVPLDGETIYMQQKIENFLCIINQCDNSPLHHYVLDGRYFTLKMRKKDEKKIDQLILHTLCRISDGCIIVSREANPVTPSN